MITVRVRVDGRLRMPVADVPERMLEQMRIRFSYPNPENKSSRSRAGQESPDWCALTEEAGHYCLPRGLVDGLRNCAQGAGVDLQFESRATGDPSGRLSPLEDWAITPRPYQREIVDALVSRVQGYVVLPCGGGKTTAGVAAILRVGQPAIVLVGSTDLLDQWAETITRATAGMIKPRRVGGGTRPDLSPLRPGEIAVVMVQSIAGSDSDADPFLRSAAVVLADEAHHCPAQQLRSVLNRCPARWRWGLTATPDRADGWGFLLRVLLGPCLYQKSARDLVDLGYLQTPTIIPVASAWTPGPAEHRWTIRCPSCGQVGDFGWSSWQQGKAECSCRVLVKGKRARCGTVLPVDAEAHQSTLDWGVTSSSIGVDSTRNELLGILAGAAVEQGRKALVLVGRKAALDPVAHQARLHNAGSVAVVASGVGDRKGIIERLKNGRTDVLVATQLADEGLDVPDLDCVILGQPGKDGGRAKQRTGRTTRLQGQPPVVFDVVDAGGVLRSQWRSRRKAYEAEYGPRCLAAREPVSLDEALRLMRECT